MARVLLILPPWYRFLGEGFNEIPLGLCYLSASLRRRGHETAVLNCDLAARGPAGPEKIFTKYKDYRSEFSRFEDPVWNQVKAEIERFAPDFVGIHTKTAAIKSVLKVAEIAKTVNSNICVVAGGVHATLLPEDMARMPNIDFVIKGEGEETFYELVRKPPTADTSSIPGLVYERAGEIVDGGVREPIKDIDSIPFPDRENLIHREQYSSYGFGVIVTGRGCPFLCTYCAAKKMWPGAVRFRSTDNIIDEIKHVKEKHGTRYFNFRDDTFTVNKKRAMEICERIISEKLNIVWRCDTRADSLDDELVRMMKRAHCVQASIGIESGSDRILKLVKKGETAEEIGKGIALLRKYRIPVSAFIMIGFPTETREEALATLNFAKGLKVDTLVLSILTPYPGTEVYEWFKERGLVAADIDYSDFYHQSPVMGAPDLRGDDYEAFLNDYFSDVRNYNRNPLRLLRRFAIVFANNPKGAIERAMSYFYK